jgi:tetratricopeptide (TPR) repeat protein
LTGWQKGGGFTVHALIKRPDLFEGYIAATPYFNDDYQLDFTALKAAVSRPNNEKYLYGRYRWRMRFDNAKDFRAKGGMDHVKAYYAKKAQRYGGSDEIDAGGLWALLRVAMAENNLSFFKQLMQMKQKLNSKTHVNWMLRYAAFYQKHGEKDKAIAYYQKTAALNPQSIKTLAGLAQAYVAAKQTNKQTMPLILMLRPLS